MILKIPFLCYKFALVNRRVFFLSAFLWAQQDPQFTQYMFNRFGLNPAAAGYLGAWNITGVSRLQWIGIDGHPQTFMVSGHGPVNFLRGGVGLSLVGDQIGPFRTVDLKGAYAFRLPLGQAGSALQLGVSGGILNKALDGASLRPEQIPDPALLNRAISLTTFDVNAGVYFSLPEERWYLGISALHLTEPSLKEFTVSGRSKVPRHFYATTGARFRLSENVTLHPSTFFKLAQNQLMLDLNLNLQVQPVVLGLSYRLGDAVCGIIGLQATENLLLAYSYDYTTSRLGAVTWGSHELLISYTFASLLKLLPPNLGVRDKKDFR